MSAATGTVLAGTSATAAVLALSLLRQPSVGRALPSQVPRADADGPLDRATQALCRALRLPPTTRATRRRIRWMACAVTAAGFVAPPLAALLVAALWIRSRHRTLRARRCADRAVADALPDAVDLLLLATSAGLSLPLAHVLVAERIGHPLGEALRTAAAEADQGRARADALVDALSPLGERALSLGHALADHLRYGVPLGPGLERMGSELRLDRRRRAEQDARRVPVRLLAPLVACVLPAFALLTVVPLLAASLRALPT
jgi:tight adherence protein C